jgi:hypothetical protein
MHFVICGCVTERHSVRMIKPVLLAACLFAPAAVAQEANAPPPPIHVTYSAYAHGFNVIDLDATLVIAPARYKVELNFALVGVLGVVLHADGKTVVSGRFAGTHAQPEELYSAGHFRGDPRVTQVVWRGGNPQILQLQPPNDTERDPVPVAMQVNTIDTLSAMAALIHQVSESGKCDGYDRTFDGRRLSEISAHTVGEETLDPTSRSAFRGTALRCNFEGKQLAGFRRDQDQEELSRVQHGSAWFARVQPGEPPVPVRVEFETPQFGQTTMYLTGVH